jgi:hypothetical protein
VYKRQLYLDRAGCLTAAADIGAATARLTTALLADRVVERLPMARRLLALRDRYGDKRLEAACARAWRYDDASYKTVKQILRQGLDQMAEPAPAPVATAKEFARSAAELLGGLFEGKLSWN